MLDLEIALILSIEYLALSQEYFRLFESLENTQICHMELQSNVLFNLCCC